MSDQNKIQKEQVQESQDEYNMMQEQEIFKSTSCGKIQMAQLKLMYYYRKRSSDQDHSELLKKNPKIRVEVDAYKSIKLMNTDQDNIDVSQKNIDSKEDKSKEIRDKTLLVEKNFLKFCQSILNNSSIPINFLKEQLSFEFSFPTKADIQKIHKSLCNKEVEDPFKILKNWKLNEIKLLVWIVTNLCDSKKYDLRAIPEEEWKFISSLLWQKDEFSCKTKWFQLQKMTIYQVPWTKQEEEKLTELVLRYQEDNLTNLWSTVANDLNKELNLSFHRSGKKCRDRWLNKLNPTLSKTLWKDEEEIELLRLVLENGKRWAQISKHLTQCRSQNDVKNHFYSLLRKGDKLQKSEIQQTKGEVVVQTHPQILENLQNISHDDLDQQELAIINASIEKLIWRQKHYKGEQTNANIHTTLPINLESDGMSLRSKLNHVLDQPKQEINHKQDLQQFTRKSLRKIEAKVIAEQPIIDGHSLNPVLSLLTPIPHLNGKTVEMQLKQEVEVPEFPQQTKPSMDHDGRYFKCFNYEQIKLAEIHQLQPCLINQNTETIYQLNQQQLIEYVAYIQQTMVSNYQQYKQRQSYQFAPISNYQPYKGFY